MGGDCGATERGIGDNQKYREGSEIIWEHWKHYGGQQLIEED